MSEAQEFYKAPEHGWVCFHCGEHFPGDMAGGRRAKQHFGDTVRSAPGCRLRMQKGEHSLLRIIRVLQRQLRELESRVANEDTEKDREMYSMQSDHQVALRREEEKGYARGLRDGMALPFNSELRSITETNQ
jgi:hypothetical protein